MCDSVVKISHVLFINISIFHRYYERMKSSFYAILPANGKLYEFYHY